VQTGNERGSAPTKRGRKGQGQLGKFFLPRDIFFGKVRSLRIEKRGGCRGVKKPASTGRRRGSPGLAFVQKKGWGQTSKTETSEKERRKDSPLWGKGSQGRRAWIPGI